MLNLSLGKSEMGSKVTCRAVNPHLDSTIMDDTWIVDLSCEYCSSKSAQTNHGWLLDNHRPRPHSQGDDATRLPSLLSCSLPTPTLICFCLDVRAKKKGGTRGSALVTTHDPFLSLSSRTKDCCLYPYRGRCGFFLLLLL